MKTQVVNFFCSGARIEVTFCDSGHQCNATVQRRDGTNLLIACDDIVAPYLIRGRQVKLKHGADDQCFEIESAVSAYQMNYCVVPMTTPQIIQRRRHTRVSCKLKATCTPRFLIAAGPSDASQSQTCQILNISFGGLLLAASGPMLFGSHINIDSDLEEGTDISLSVEVMRCTTVAVATPQSNPRMSYRIGCRFLDLSRTDQIRLRRYVTSYLPIGLSS